MQRVCRQLEGAFTLVAVDAQDPDRVVAARRNSPLVVGLGEGENFLGSDVAAFIEHTREALELGQDQVVTITRDGVTVTDFDGTPAEGRRYHVDWDLSAAEKDGHDWFMRKEIYEQPRAVADSLLGRRTRRGTPAPRRDAALRRGAARHRQDHHHRVRHVVLRRHGREVRDRALDPDPGRGRAGLGVPLPRPDPRPLARWSSRSASPARPPTPCRRSGTRGPQRSKVLAICNTNGSTIPRESDAVIYTHAGPEIGVASTKGFLTQLVACYLLALYLAQVKGTRYGDEIDEVMRRARGDARRTSRRCSTAPRRSTTLARDARRRPDVGAVPRPARRLPGRARGRAQAQGAGLHARRGLRRRRAQARPDRADRGRPAGVRASCRPAGRDQLHDKMVSGIQEVRARGARTICLAEEGDDASRRTPTS